MKSKIILESEVQGWEGIPIPKMKTQLLRGHKAGDEGSPFTCPRGYKRNPGTHQSGWNFKLTSNFSTPEHPPCLAELKGFKIT
jgi:hypothetical protein